MKKPTSRKKKIIEVIFTVLGTAVVAVTFYVHEIKRENARQTKDVIEHASEQKDTRDQFLELRTLILTKAQHQTPVQVNKTPNQQAFTLFSILLDQAGNIEAAQTEIENTRILADTLKNKTDLVQQIEDRKKEFALLYEKQTRFFQRNGPLLSTKPLTDKEEDNIASEAIDLLNEWHAISGKTQKVLDAIIKEGHVESKAAQSSYDRATVASYYLYPLGFLLALIGKLVGIEIDEGSD